MNGNGKHEMVRKVGDNSRKNGVTHRYEQISTNKFKTVCHIKHRKLKYTLMKEERTKRKYVLKYKIMEK